MDTNYRKNNYNNAKKTQLIWKPKSQTDDESAPTSFTPANTSNQDEDTNETIAPAFSSTSNTNIAAGTITPNDYLVHSASYNKYGNISAPHIPREKILLQTDPVYYSQHDPNNNYNIHSSRLNRKGVGAGGTGSGMSGAVSPSNRPRNPQNHHQHHHHFSKKGDPNFSKNMDSGIKSPSMAKKKKPTVVFEEHLRFDEVQNKLKSGEFKRGIVRTLNNEAIVNIEGAGELEVLVEGKYLNRAFDGDEVIISIFPEDKWVVKNNKSSEEQLHQKDEEKLRESETDVKQTKIPTGKVVYIWDKLHERKKFFGFIKIPLEFTQSENLDISETSVSTTQSQSQSRTPKQTPKGKRKEYKLKETTNQESKKIQPRIINPKYVYFIPRDQTNIQFLIAENIPEEVINNQEDLSNILFEAKFKEWTSDMAYPTGSIIRMIGLSGTVSTETEIILILNSLNHESFTSEILKGLPSSRELEDYEVIIRSDFRKERIFSITDELGPIDSAFSCQVQSSGNFRVGIHLSDVSHYVRPNTPLDQLARDRSVSFQTLHKNIPMLPPTLEEHFCSLQPGSDRYALSIVFEITPTGKVISHRFYKSIIQSCLNLNFNDAQKIIDNPEKGAQLLNGLVREHEEQLICEDILNLNRIANSITVQNGTIFGSFWRNRRKLSFDRVTENSTTTTFRIAENSQSVQLVKIFMRLANIYVAKEILAFSPSHCILVNQELPSQSHPFIELCQFLGGSPIDLTNINSFQESINKLIVDHSHHSSSVKEILEELAKESIQYPVYFCRGEGNSMDDIHIPYTHSTRPIRSYLDIMVHRLLNNSINKIKIRITPNTIQLACKQTNNIIQRMNNISFQIQLALLSFGLKKVPIKGDCTVIQFDANSILVFSPELWLKYRIQLSPLEYEVNYNEQEKSLTYRYKASVSGINESDKNYSSITIKPFNEIKIQFMVSEPPNSQLKALLPKSLI